MRGAGLVLEILRVSLDSIRSNKLRSGLTTLGIVIGICAVITMVALGEGAQANVQEQIQRMGTDVLSVQPGSGWFNRGRRNRSIMRVEDAQLVAVQASSVSRVAPRMDASYQVEFGRVNGNFRIVGTTPDYAAVGRLETSMGRFFTEDEERGRRRVAVLGSAIPEALEVEAVDLLGQQIHIRNIRFEVIGILEEQGAGGGPGGGQDDQILVPLETAQFRLMGTDRIGGFDAMIAQGASMDVAMLEIEESLRRAHRLRPGDPNDFWIQNRAELLTMFEETSRTFTFLLAGIAAVSLLVGGIGIMNIMLVSVSERTKEIGLRKSLGARRRDIMLQFLVEALVLCLAGGILGILLGAAASEGFSRVAGWDALISTQAVAVAVAFSGAVGLFFGIWPARRAAKLDPIDALRYE